MRKLLLLSLFVPAAFGQTAISANHITDAFGHPIPVAKLCFVPVDASLSPAGFRFGSTQVVPNETCAAVTAGAIASGMTVIPSTAAINYHVYLKQGFSNTVLRDYGSTPITGSSWSLDSFDPASGAPTPVSPVWGAGVGVPSSCSSPSVWVQTDTPHIYVCESGTGVYSLVPTVGPQGPPGEVTTAALNAAVNPISLAVYGTPSLNLFDYTAATTGSVVNSATGATVTGLSGYTLTDYMVVTGGTQFVSTGNMGTYGGIPSGVAFYTGTKAAPVFLSGYGSSATPNPISAGTTIPVPSGATLMRLYFEDSKQTLPYSQIMVCLGASCPASYVAFGSTGGVGGAQSTATAAQSTATAALATATAAQTAAQPMAGVNTCWLGDSISYGLGSGLALSPLVAAITGGVDYYSLSWSGRRMYDALDNTGNTGVAFPTSSTIANCKVLVLWLSTNFDGSATGNIGSIGDTASVGTSNANGITFPSTDSYVANAKGVLNQLYAWNPALRIIMVDPYQSAIRNAPSGCTGYGAGVLPCAAGLAVLYTAVQANAGIGSLYSIPILDTYDEIGINAANSAARTVDGVHPTATTQQKLIAPYLAHKLSVYAPQ